MFPCTRRAMWKWENKVWLPFGVREELLKVRCTVDDDAFFLWLALRCRFLSVSLILCAKDALPFQLPLYFGFLGGEYLFPARPFSLLETLKCAFLLSLSLSLSFSFSFSVATSSELHRAVCISHSPEAGDSYKMKVKVTSHFLTLRFNFFQCNAGLSRENSASKDLKKHQSQSTKRDSIARFDIGTLLWTEKLKWTIEEVTRELRPLFYCGDDFLILKSRVYVAHFSLIKMRESHFSKNEETVLFHQISRETNFGSQEIVNPSSPVNASSRYSNASIPRMFGFTTHVNLT